MALARFWTQNSSDDLAGSSPDHPKRNTFGRLPIESEKSAYMTEFRFPPFKIKPIHGFRCSLHPHDGCQDVGAPAGTRSLGRTRASKAGTPAPLQPNHICAYADPGHAGPYSCTYTKAYSIKWSKDGKTSLPAKLYLPGTNWNGLCVPAAGPFPLVILLHALGIPGFMNLTYHHAYGLLAQHLASHGFIVASLSRRTDIPEFADNGDIIEEHVHHLFTKEISSKRLQNLVALIGHSSGGAMVISNARRVSAPHDPLHTAANLGAVVLMATTVPQSLDELIDFSSVTGAFMGIMNSSDGDPDAYGPKDSKSPMKSVLGVYDIMGASPYTPWGAWKKTWST